jgi:hypothetical protein
MEQTYDYPRRVTLTIEGKVYDRLLNAAEAERRSPKDQVLVFLERALGLRGGTDATRA